MDHDLRLQADLLVDEEAVHVRPLVAGQLDDLAHLAVLRDRPVALEVLLEGLADALDISIVGQALNGGNTLPPVALLHADVDLRLVSLIFVRIIEGVERIKILDLGLRHHSAALCSSAAGLRGRFRLRHRHGIGAGYRSTRARRLRVGSCGGSRGAPRAAARTMLSREATPQRHRGARSVHHSISD